MNIACGALKNIEPVKAPVWKISSASAAVILPSLVQPILIRERVPETGPVQRNTSFLVSTILTGRRAFFDSTTASGSP